MSLDYTGTHDFTNATVVGVGGGGGASRFDATVGSGGDYADVQAAITGVGGTDIKLVLISDVTEDSDIVLPDDLVLLLHLSSYTLTMAANQFTNSTGTTSVYVRGNGIGSGAEIDYTAVGANEELFDVFGAASVTDCEGFVFDNNSATTGSDLADAGIIRLRDMQVNIGNAEGCGVILSVDGSYLSNVHFVGGGTSCEECVTLNTADVYASNLVFTGTFAASGTNTPVLIVNSGTIANNIIFEHDTADISLRFNGSTVSNLEVRGSFGADIFTNNGSGCIFSNFDLNGGDIDPALTTDSRFTNIVTTGGLDLTDSNSSNNVYSGCRITGAVAVAGDKNKFSNCDFLGGASVSSTGANNLFSNCQFGPDAGGGALTLTFDASSVGNGAANCIVDAIMVDNGTGNAQDYIIY